MNSNRQAKTLVVFFSRSGHTRRIARALAQRLNAEVEDLSVVQSREGLIGKKPVATLALTTHEVEVRRISRLDEFALALKSSVAAKARA